MPQNTFSLKPQKSSFDYLLPLSTAILVITGLIAIYDVSVVAAFRDFNDKLYFFKNQLVWASLGFVSMGFFSLFDYHKIIKLASLSFITGLFLLVLVLVPHVGTEVLGARRWINIGSFTFQPSEFVKLALIFYATAIMVKFEKYKITIVDSLIVYFLPIMIATALVAIQPDLGTALLLIGLSLFIYFVSNAPIKHFILAIPPLIIGSVVAIIAEPYRLERIKSFLDPNHDPQGSSYQIFQIIIALKEGGLLGVGLGGSRSKFEFIPEVHNDAIFAVIVEELGFVGAIILIAIFLFLINRAIMVAKGAQDYSGKILASGIVALIAIQSLFNLASVVALVPLTGIPLPFISYGGSSLFVTMTAIGILLNINRQS